MTPPVDHHDASADTKREGEAQTPETGRDIERPRGGVKGPLFGLGLLVLLVVAGLIAWNVRAGVTI